jgi:hypothetical protein
VLRLGLGLGQGLDKGLGLEIGIGLYLSPQTTQLADHVISSPLPEELARFFSRVFVTTIRATLMQNINIIYS